MAFRNAPATAMSGQTYREPGWWHNPAYFSSGGPGMVGQPDAAMGLSDAQMAYQASQGGGNDPFGYQQAYQNAYGHNQALEQESRQRLGAQQDYANQAFQEGVSGMDQMLRDRYSTVMGNFDTGQADAYKRMAGDINQWGAATGMYGTTNMPLHYENIANRQAMDRAGMTNSLSGDALNAYRDVFGQRMAGIDRHGQQWQNFLGGITAAYPDPQLAIAGYQAAGQAQGLGSPSGYGGGPINGNQYYTPPPNAMAARPRTYSPFRGRGVMMPGPAGVGPGVGVDGDPRRAAGIA